ncbi:MAG TPA: hypothetical protein PKY73_08460 [Hyphomonas sp.]|nr:hypothetical protein [Hyphomonas sp.]
MALSSVLNASSHDRAPNGQAQTLPDPVVASVEAWMSDYSKREAMMLEWQDWEVALCERIRPLGIGLTRGHRSRLPEARSMRALDRKIKALGKKLDKRAARIILTRVTSTKAALAKIEMGMRIQGPYDWEDYAFALIQDGCEQLRKWL